MRQSYLHEIFLQQTVHPRFCHLHGADLVGDVTAFDQYHLQLKEEIWTQPCSMGYTSQGSGSGLAITGWQGGGGRFRWRGTRICCSPSPQQGHTSHCKGRRTGHHHTPKDQTPSWRGL